MRKNNLISVFGMLLCVISILAQNNYAQKTAATVPVKGEKGVLQNYIELSALAITERRRITGTVSAEEKAALMKFHLAFQFIKRPDMTAEQKALLAESILMIGPDLYSDNEEKQAAAHEKARLLEPRAKNLFPGRDGAEIFANIGANPEDAKILQKYRDLISRASMAERRAEFRNLSPVDKSNVWKIQIAVHLAQSMNLTKEQQEFLLRSFDFIRAEMYSIQKDNPKRSELDVLLQKFTMEAIELFGKKDVAMIFAKIGNEPKTETGVGIEAIKPDCECSHTSDWCSSVCAGNICKKVQGCGFLWQYECTGTCAPISQW